MKIFLTSQELELLLRLNDLIRIIKTNKRLNELVVYYQNLCEIMERDLNECSDFNLLSMYDFLNVIDHNVEVNHFL